MRIQATTGITKCQYEELVDMVVPLLGRRSTAGRQPVLDPATQVRLTGEHLRTNAAQQVLAEHYAVSQPTVSRVIAAVLPLIDSALTGFDQGLSDVGAHHALVVDGTIVCTGRRAGHERLYNGKHKIYGVNVQILATLDGAPVWASPPRPGADHDLVCFRAHRLDALFNTRTGIADAGYQGHHTTGLVTPAKRRPGHELTDDHVAFNHQLAAHRALIERVNAWLKNWKVLSTRYRRTWKQLALTIRTTFRLLRYQQLTPAENEL